MVAALIVAAALAALFAGLYVSARAAGGRIKAEAEGVQRRDAEALRRAQRRAELLHRLVDGIEDGLFILGADLRVLFVNLGAQHFFPPVTEPVGRRLGECVPHPGIVSMVEEALATGQRFAETFQVSRGYDVASGEDRHFEVIALPLQAEASQIAEGNVLLILRDETQKHTLEKIRKDFVANASHELRTPLSIIIGYLENLISGDLDAADQQRAFVVMKKHGDRLAQIVEDLLVISRMESGQESALRLEEFDLRECAEDVIHRLSPVIAERGARVGIDVAPGVHTTLRGDRFYWDQILFNLVQNALKENPARGLGVTLAFAEQGDRLQVEVRDDGVGIPAADVPFVFKRFYRVTRDQGPQAKGTGLGLSIVKRAVEAHHGTITLRSTPGVETVFTISVPRRP